MTDRFKFNATSDLTEDKIPEVNEFGYTPEAWAALTYRQRWCIKNRARVRAAAAKYRDAHRAEINAKERKRRRSPEVRAQRNASERARIAKMTPEQRKRDSARRAALSRKYYAKQKAERDAVKAAQQAERQANAPAWRKEARAAFDRDHTGLQRRIHKAVPRHFPKDIRDDIAMDITVALLDGEISLSEIEARANHYARRNFQVREWWSTVSLDLPIAGTNDLRLIDTLTQEDVWN